MTVDALPDIGAVSTTEIDGLVIRHARSGAANGVPILLTAPWPESIYAFRHVIPRLRQTHPLIAVDLPGFGLSQSRPDVMAPKAMGDFVIKLLSHFKVNRAHAITPDVGALAILFAAAEKGDLFESIALGSGALRAEMAAGVLYDLIHSPTGAFATVDGAEAVGDYLKHASELTPAPIIEDFRKASAGRRFEDAVQYVRNYIPDLPKLEPLLSSIDTPILIIAGKDDPIVPAANGQFLAERLPRNHYVLLDAQHRAWEEAADGYTGEIAVWMNGAYRSQSGRT
ncbi:alpha/beta fold hydrolase [Terricaulis silvestris]|uniref:Soluble epoxide hydrolase n=1 Tax=Terricaulis silvestris TaxID=2686094 RepID=A0A6I6ML61_9CAUL|nr:alpha/beta hydrolase [Terricaulis silvestris]QGZ93704.1 Soluble epoxide hydrolase [Terricaulis silvestris]